MPGPVFSLKKGPIYLKKTDFIWYVKNITDNLDYSIKEIFQVKLSLKSHRCCAAGLKTTLFC